MFVFDENDLVYLKGSPSKELVEIGRMKTWAVYKDGSWFPTEKSNKAKLVSVTQLPPNFGTHPRALR